MVLNRLNRQVRCGSAPVDLTAKEFSVLEHLMLHQGEIVTRSTLLDRVWDMHFDPGSNVVDVTVTRLRRKLEGAGADVRIASVRGSGFMLELRSVTAQQ
jgi:two-component system OmpR family response regulator